MHLFYDCLIVKKLWNQLTFILSNNLIFAISTPQSSIFRFWNLDTNEYLILNDLLLAFKTYIYNARATGYLNISHLLIYIKGTTTPKRMSEKCKKEKKIPRNGKTF